MSKEQIIAAVLAASPAKCREIENVLNGTIRKSGADEDVRLVSITGTARLTRLSRSAVYQIIKQGRLDVVELTGSRRVTMKSIREFLAGERPTNAATEAARHENAKRYAAGKNQTEG